MPVTSRRPRQAQAGVSLIEALVAMVVLSLGLLGLASLQINALKYNQVALMRSQAATLAYQMLDAMRASPTDAKALTGGVFPAGTGLDGAYTEWLTKVSELPGGDADICLTSNPNPTTACTGAGDYAVISVEWSEADDSGTRSTRKFQLVSQVAK